MNGLTVAIAAPGGRSGGFFLGLWRALVCVPPLTPQSVRAVSRLVGMSDEAGDAVRRVIKAYHGSPHNFDTFDASKIGTGEGAQSYGHGLYFAGNEHVARTYRDISPVVPSGEAGKVLQGLRDRAVALELEASRIRDAMELAAEARGTPSPGWGNLRDVPPDVAASLAPRLRSVMDELQSVRGDLSRPKRGHMYEVEIDYPEEALLDWDKPVGAKIAGRMDGRMAGDLAAEAQRMADMGQLPRHMQALNRIASGEIGLAPGEMVYRAAGRFDPPASRPGWGSVTSTINDSVTNQARAAERLLGAGIPGIRDLDQGSRAAGEGTRNYVMFPGTEDRIRILRKFGILAPMGAGMGGSDE